MAVDPARAKSLFLAASDLADAAERAAYLDRECGGDPDLLARVEGLLRANDASPLPEPEPKDATGTYGKHGEARPQDFVDPAVSINTVIAGKYKLVEEIGEGGMGHVYMAQQTEPIRRAVAVKVIKAGMDSKAVLARFEAERQALAMMDHPNIARVLDAGVTDNGRPFFVMELIKGVPITEFCDARKLTLRQRLELFVPVCEAIQHAHQKGIIHRDIKPSNVIVALYDDRPVPKVIDFGIAKAVRQPLTDRTLMTGFGAVVGTPEYMSPEQASFNQVDVDTRSDVYALGVLLYELLTGGTPIDRKSLDKAAVLEVLRIVREVEVPRPSAKLSTLDTLPNVAANRGIEPTKLSKMFRGELDWVLMKALEKDRARRYDTANGLSRDIQRYLADELVEARPPSAGYRLKKFVRRHKGQVIAASLVLFALLTGIAGTTFGLFRAEHRRAEAEQARADEAAQRQIAEAQKKKAEQAEADTLADYRASTDDAIEQLIGSKPELGPQERTYLENTLKRWQAFAARQGDDERSRAIRGEGHFNVALLWQKLSRSEESRAEYQAARDIRKNLVEQFPAVPKYQQALSGTHNNLGSLLADLGKHEAARAEYLAARDLGKKLVEQFPAVPAYQQDLARAHNNLGKLLAGLGQREAARAEYQAACQIGKKLVEQFPAVPMHHQILARTHHNLGNLLKGLGKVEEARTEYQAAREIGKKLVEQFPAVPSYQQQIAATHNTLGNLFADLGQGEAARAEYQAARDIRRKLVEQFPAVPAYQIELGGSYCNYGILIRDDGKPAESLEWFDLAIRRLKSVHDQEPRDVTAKQFLRNSYDGRAQAYDRLAKPAEAIKDWDRAIELSPPAAQSRLRASRATSRLQAGMVAEAVAEVAELTKDSNWNAGQWYDFACVYAVASTKFADQKVTYKDRAMELLSQAVKAGYKDAAHLARDPDLAPLRQREDFQKLLAALESGKK